ncbi:MAG: exo-alpha-sialidase [Clostridia bacterium]|nr:exo-alpha-sialidase [Clostridia bacterium]
MQPWKLYRSNDDGKTWSKLANIVDEVNGYIPGYQPYLYELPVDIGNYKKGTLLMAACSRNAAENERTHIILQASTDLGESWTGVCNIAIGGSFSDGIWEPVLQYDEHTKKLYCFYSDQSDENYSQKLVFKSTTDLKNWSDIKNMVALSDSTLAPGMVALTKMGNGKWALAYEIGSSSGPLIHIKFADFIDDWDPSDKGMPVADKNTGGMCRSGPAIAWTPAGGDCGTLIVTSHDDQNNAGTETKCGLFLSFDYGKNFVVIENPIPNMSNEFCSSGYSPGFYVDKEGTVYYVNNPECYRNSFNEKLMFARIRVY